MATYKIYFDLRRERRLIEKERSIVRSSEISPKKLSKLVAFRREQIRYLKDLSRLTEKEEELTAYMEDKIEKDYVRDQFHKAKHSRYSYTGVPYVYSGVVIGLYKIGCKLNKLFRT